MIKKIKKRIIIFQAKLNAFMYEKTYMLPGNPTKQKYLYMPSKNSDTLVVIFPACFDQGAKYDYVSTIKDFSFHKIFILDDSAENGRGNYIMGINREVLISLLKKKIEELNVRKIIFAGSSKGGAMAVIFAHYIKGVDVVCGAPTYHLAHRMYDGQNRQNVETIIEPPVTLEKVDSFDNKIRELITQSCITPKSVNIMYSKLEPTYETNIIDLLDDMAQREYPVTESLREFTIHGLVGKFFKPYLYEYLTKLEEGRISTNS